MLMLWRSIKMQLKVIYEKKVAMIMLFLLLTLVLINYFGNVFTYQGFDVVNMYHPMKLLTLSSYSEYGYYLMQYFPLLVVIPAGFSLYADKHSNQLIYIESRVGARDYYWGKLIVTFLVTFFVFTAPFLIEIILNLIAFPFSATGHPSNLGYYERTHHLKQILFSELYIRAPYLYAVFFTFLFGLFSGILAVFTVAISTFRIKFKVLLFLPVYLLLYFIGMLNQLIPTLSVFTNYFFYLSFYHHHPNASTSFYMYLIFMLFILGLSIFIMKIKMKKDTL